jgi:hypothetical protein
MQLREGKKQIRKKERRNFWIVQEANITIESWDILGYRATL